MQLRTFSLLVLILGLAQAALPGAWFDRTSGLPPVEIVSAKTMGTESANTSIVQDKFGRLFIGSTKLLVFDGQSWRSFPKPTHEPITSLTMGENGVLWTGAVDELGFFQEERLGIFQYHSLLTNLPKEHRNIGIVWGCIVVGKVTYFICRDLVLQWNGKSFKEFYFDTASRLFPAKIGNEAWFWHAESGLYRLTEKGFTLEVPADQLSGTATMGLFRDETGLVTVGNYGLIRPGIPTKPISQQNLNEYLEKHIVSAFAELPDGNLAIGTISGGLVWATRSGEMISVWDSKNVLPGNTIYNLTTDSDGDILGVTPTDFFQFPASGKSTQFNPKNGLTGDVVNYLTNWKANIYAATEDGVFQLSPSANGSAAFRLVPGLEGVFSHILPYRDGFLLTRFAGVDWFDGFKLHSVYSDYIGSAHTILSTRANQTQFYVTETYGISRINDLGNSWNTQTHLQSLPGECTTSQEDLTGRLWIGTHAKGAFTYDPQSKALHPINNPVTNARLSGYVRILSNEQRIVLFTEDGILEADANGGSLKLLLGMPLFTALSVQCVPNEQDIFIAYQSARGSGVGVMCFTAQDQPIWRELEIPSLGSIGRVRSTTFSEEAGRPILWLGGTEGILRVDYQKIQTMQPPRAPIIRSSDPLTFKPVDHHEHAFLFNDHHVELMVYTGDYVRGKDWLIQTRLDDGEWASPAPRRSFEYTNLSEGKYRFEARAVNSAGMVSAASAIEFTILPPWYRSSGAYTGYAAGLALGVFGFIRLRERQIHRRNRELETLVARRTDELVKANAAKDEFLASVSHEIRNPMNGVIGIAESFKTAGLDPEGRHKFHLLRQCAGHLSSLLEDLLDFSRVQAGAVELESKPFDLAELMASVTALSSAESERRGIPVEIAISPNVPRQLTGDQRRIRQILLNFVNNALNFSNRGEVSVTVWCKIAGPRLTEVFFAVTDEGPGISEEEQKKLFTRFERGTAAKQARVPGTGLGLALCRTLAEQMGGRIWLESELGAGSSFYFSAPFETAEAAAPPPPPAPLAGELQSALVVDDEEYNRIALADLLESLGFEVQSATDGPEALALAGRRDFDVIFLDCAMPGLSGLEVARAIRAMPNRSARALVLAVTAFNTPDKRAQCLAAGMDGFLGKPINMERLRQALASFNPRGIADAPGTNTRMSADDPYAKLRLLAAKKQITLGEELSLFLGELEDETAQLVAASHQKSARESEHFAHLLCGRAGFVGEHELELILRKIGDAAASARWAEAVSLGHEVETRVAALRVRLVSAAPAAPPGSAR